MPLFWYSEQVRPYQSSVASQNCNDEKDSNNTMSEDDKGSGGDDDQRGQGQARGEETENWSLSLKSRADFLLIRIQMLYKLYSVHTRVIFRSTPWLAFQYTFTKVGAGSKGRYVSGV